jgi:hypothetical protein
METDRKDLIRKYNKTHGKEGPKAKVAELVEDDPYRGPVYVLKDEGNKVLAHGWFGASGAEKFIVAQ